MAVTGRLTPALEDYLEAILVIGEEKEEVRVIDIANRLGVTMASVTGSMRKLASMKYIVYEKRRSVRLTPDGEKAAAVIRRRHRELFAFYHDILGADADRAEESACRVEHVLDQSILERIIRLSKWLRELPDETFENFRNEVCSSTGGDDGMTRTLDTVDPGCRAVVKKIKARGGIGRRMMDMGIVKGSEIEVVRAAPLGDPIDIKVKGFHLSLRKSEAANIEVEC